MSRALEMDAKTATLADIEGMIFDLVFRFCERYQTEFDETLSLARLAFCESFKTYDKKRASFPTYACQKILSKLYEWQRTSMRRQILGKIVATDLDEVTHPQNDFWLFEFMDSLSRDAKIVVRLTLDSPMDIRHGIMERGGKSSPIHVKSALREFLGDCGWTAARIAESFAEVTEAL